MTEDEVIKLARDIGREMPTDPPGIEYLFNQEELIELVGIAVKAEREACAKLCDVEWNGDADTYEEAEAYKEIAADIRARSSHDQL